MATIINGNSYRFKAWNDNLYLNIYTRGSLANGQNVCTYALTGTDMAQVWDVTNYSGYGVSGQLMKSRKNNAYALDHWRGSTNTHNADIYAVGTSAGDLRDQLVEFVVISNGCYRIKLKYPTSEGSYLYLTVNTSTTPHNVYWTTLTGNTDQLWYRELYRGSNPPRVSSSIRNTTWMVKNLESGKYLNVYGNDTVVNSRNVTVYDLENCQAQRWVIKNTTNGPKLFTKINEAFALNIYNSNCNMYTAGGNDDDSLLQFEQVSGNVYRIRMYRHGLYLNEDGTASGSNVSWTSSVGSSSLWQLESEGDAFPSAGQAPVSLTDTVFYVRNYQTGYMLNVYGNETVANGRNVNTYSKADVDAEKWKVINTANGPKIYSELGKSNGRNVYAINYYNDNCVMYSSQGTNNDYDSLLVLEPYDALERIYRIKLFNYDGYLYAESIGSGADVRWSSNVNLYTLWQFITPEELSQETPDPLHSEIKDHTFCIRPYGKQVYLNVHGNDTVTNGRNVNLFSLTDCLAQKWEPRDTANGPKLFTEIDSRFALNIYGSGNTNCTMYAAEGNDSDSILEFIRVSRYRYLIKMYHHDLYLTYSGEGATGDNVYWDVLSESKVWEFVPVEDVEFPQGTTIPRNADSALVTSFIPAITTNYTQDRASEGGVISEICIHHMAGNMSIEALGAMWQTEGRNGSSHYGVNGRSVGQYVKERDIAWTNGDWTSNKRSVTIEVANISTTDPNWTVSDETLDTLVKLIADIARRNGLGLLTKGVNLTWHSMYSATACPGPYLTSKLDEIVERANDWITAMERKIYLNKTGTDLFLGEYANHNVILTEADNAKAFFRHDTKLYDYYDMTRFVCSVNSAPVMSNLTGAAMTVLQDAYGGLSLNDGNRAVAGMINGLQVTSDDVDKFRIVQSPAAAPVTGGQSSMPEQYMDWVVRIKNSSNGMYLTLNEDTHPCGTGKRISLARKVDNAKNQLWKILSNGNDTYSIVSFKGLGTIDTSSINISVLSYDAATNSAIGRVSSTASLSERISFSPSGTGYVVTLDDLGKALHMTTYGNDMLVRWNSSPSDVWIIEEPEPVIVDGWMKLHYNPQNEPNPRDVRIENYAYCIENGQTLDPDGTPIVTYVTDGIQYVSSFEEYNWGGNAIINYRFLNRYNWFTGQKHSVRTYAGNQTLINPYRYEYLYENNIMPDIHIDQTSGGVGALVDDNGLYWVAVGPKVPSPDHQDGAPTAREMYGRGTLDAVLKDLEYNCYYLHCKIGGAKEHTYNNGVFQTWYRYSDHAFETYATADYDGTVCIEFFVDPNHDGTMNYSDKGATLGAYSIVKIIFYDNPEIITT